MKKNVFCFLLITTLTSCETLHFKTPCGVQYLTSVSDDGKDAVCIVQNTCNETEAEIKPLIDCNNSIGIKPEYRATLDDYFYDKISRLEVCLYSKKACR
jgi:hypothetical protein